MTTPLQPPAAKTATPILYTVFRQDGFSCDERGNVQKFAGEQRPSFTTEEAEEAAITAQIQALSDAIAASHPGCTAIPVSRAQFWQTVEARRSARRDEEALRGDLLSAEFARRFALPSRSLPVLRAIQPRLTPDTQVCVYTIWQASLHKNWSVKYFLSDSTPAYQQCDFFETEGQARKLRAEVRAEAPQAIMRKVSYQRWHDELLARHRAANP